MGASGVLHLVGTEPVTRRELALEVCKTFELDSTLLRFITPPEGTVGNIPVPRDTSLATERTRSVLGVELPSLEVMLTGLRAQWRTGEAQLLG